MEDIRGWIRPLNAGDLIASIIVTAGLVFLTCGTFASLGGTLVSSLQPPIISESIDYDLVAQRSMSAAAWWMVIISGVSALVGFLGIFLIARTLGETRKGADAALTAARSSEIAVRAFLLVEFAHIVIDRGALRISFRVRNSGASPAYNVAFRTRLVVSALDKSKRLEDMVTKSRSDIAATAERQASADFDKVIAAEVSDDLGRFLAEVTITLLYTDAFGRAHEETSAYGRYLRYFGLEEKLSLYRDVGNGIGWGD